MFIPSSMSPTPQFFSHFIFHSYPYPYTFCYTHLLPTTPLTLALYLFLLLLVSGDIETNPRPLPHLLRTHPWSHHQRQKTYFISRTLKLHPEYEYLSSKFIPHLTTKHPLHELHTLLHPHLNQFLQLHPRHSLSKLLYTITITLHPKPNDCNRILIHNPNPPWAHTLLAQLEHLPNSFERQITTPHPLDLFHAIHKDIITPSHSIHDKLYVFIHQHLVPPTPFTLQRQFPYLPHSLIQEALCCFEPLLEYTKSQNVPIIPTPLLQQNPQFHHTTQFITWNVSCLNTALPNLHKFITQCSPKPALIALQETKLSATKSIKYLQKLFPQYKLLFNNTHSQTTCMHCRGLPYIPMRGNLLTLIHNTCSFPNNVTKIPIPARISPYLQIINILNQSFKPWLIINIYMPSHDEDLVLIPEIQTIIIHQLTSHPNHNITLFGDFSRDIPLIGRQHNNIHVPPTPIDIQW
jgi:hypothetical protein